MTSHTYDEGTAQEVINMFEFYSKELQLFVDYIINAQSLTS
jgi:hypothetical protein